MLSPVIGVDLGKRVFQVHVARPGVPTAEKRKLSRAEVLPYLASLERGVVAMEAAGSAHYWAREVSGLGHEVRLINPKYVKPFRKGNKNDAADAEAICEAAQRPNMRFAIPRSPEHQAMLILHTLRRHAITMKVANSNALHAFMAEFGAVPAKTDGLMEMARAMLADGAESPVPIVIRSSLRRLLADVATCEEDIADIDEQIAKLAKQNPTVKLLQTIPGVGPQSASVAAAFMGDPANFRSGKEFAAFVGVAPTHWGTGGVVGVRSIPRHGTYLRDLLYQGASILITTQKAKKFVDHPWLGHLVKHKPRRVACIAQANKTARIMWAVARSGQKYQRQEPAKNNRAIFADPLVSALDRWASEGGWCGCSE
jgi:transposase